MYGPSWQHAVQFSPYGAVRPWWAAFSPRAPRNPRGSCPFRTERKFKRLELVCARRPLTAELPAGIEDEETAHRRDSNPQQQDLAAWSDSAPPSPRTAGQTRYLPVRPLCAGPELPPGVSTPVYGLRPLVVFRRVCRALRKICTPRRGVTDYPLLRSARASRCSAIIGCASGS